MAEEINLPDEEPLLIQLLRPLLPEATVLCAPDVGDTADLPLIVLSVGPGEELDPDAPEGYGYTYPAGFTVVARGRAAARDLAVKLHRVMHGFNEGGAHIEGLGHIANVETSTLPNRSGSTELGGANVTEYLAAYSVEIIPS